MLPALIEFIHRLREVAIPVSMVESLDAMEALKHIDPSNREQFRAALAVQRFGGIDAQRVGAASYYLYRVLRRLDLSNLLQRAIHEERDGPEGRTPLDESLFRDDQRRRIEELRRLIADEIR